MEENNILFEEICFGLLDDILKNRPIDINNNIHRHYTNEEKDIYIDIIKFNKELLKKNNDSVSSIDYILFNKIYDMLEKFIKDGDL